MLKLADLAAYVTTAVPGTPVVINRVQDTPDQMIMVAVVPGHGGGNLLADGAFQEVIVHVRCRATTDLEAETIAQAVDAALMNSLPIQVGATYVRNVLPMGGPPCFFERDPNNRTTYFCDYVLEAQR